MLRIVIYWNSKVLAGLTWGPCKPAGLLHRTHLAARPLALHWDDRTALVPQDPEYLGKPALLSMLAGCLSEEEIIGRVFCAYEITDRDLYFAAVLVDGKPAIGAERLFDTRAELITHIELECSNGQIDRLAIDPYLCEEIADDVTNRVPVCYLCSPESPPAPNTIQVTGKLTPHLPIWKIASGFGAVLLTLTAGTMLWFMVQPSKPIVQVSVAAVQTTFRDEIAFRQNCLDAFAGVWPLAPGWKLTSEGCATRTMRDPNLTSFTPNHPVAYRIYQVRGGFDAAIARQAADAVYAQSAIDMLIRGNRLYSSVEIAVPMLKTATVGSSTALSQETTAQAAASLTPAALLSATEAVFLGMADSIVLDGGSGGLVGSASVRIMLKSSFDDIFERVGRIEGAEIVRLSRNGEIVTLEITPRQFVIAPMLTSLNTVERFAFDPFSSKQYTQPHEITGAVHRVSLNQFNKTRCTLPRENAETKHAVPKGPPLTGGEREDLVLHVEKCWNVPTGLQNADNLAVVVAVDLTPDGKLASNPKLIYPAGTPMGATKQAFEAARRAFIRCAPYDLPSDRYEEWQHIEVVFDPEKMVVK